LPPVAGRTTLASRAALDAVARLAAARRPGRRSADLDAPVPMAGWWSFAAQLPELDL
jgi:hypothetical protein